MFSQGEGIAAGWPPQVPPHSHSQSEAILSREWVGFTKDLGWLAGWAWLAGWLRLAGWLDD